MKINKPITFILVTAVASTLFLLSSLPALSGLPQQSVYARLPESHPDVPLSPLRPLVNLDLFLPGTQPGQLSDPIAAPSSCRACHQGYSNSLATPQPAAYEPWTGWQGSMMAQAGRDPLFYAALDVANGDIPGGGEFCVRCHFPSAWLQSDPQNPPIDGTNLTGSELEGVQCEVCHRMVDPVYTAGVSPDRDALVLESIIPPVTTIGSGSIIVDPQTYRRGPFDVIADMPDNIDPHLANAARGTLKSPYHQEARFCGNCHDISNPLLSWDEAKQSYQPNDPNAPAPSLDNLFPIERTFTEWLLSDYNSPTGIYAPEFGGNKPYVATCQDCHMRDVTGVGGSFFGTTAVVRNDLPLHDLTGANTWVPQIIPLHPVFSQTFQTDPSRQAALDAGIERARYMLQNAATVYAVQKGNELAVTVINETGHKLPTGYIEGRRMWLQVEGYDAADNLIFSSGAYDVATAELDMTGDPKVYEAIHGLTEDWAAENGRLAGPSFHFILNNVVISDNRIPPRGYDFDAFAQAGAAPYTNSQPDATLYADGQYWDTTYYTLPDGVVRGTVRLMHQVASKEYIEFLRDNNPFAPAADNNGQILFDLWEMTEKSKPEVMASTPFLPEHAYLPLLLTP